MSPFEVYLRNRAVEDHFSVISGVLDEVSRPSYSLVALFQVAGAELAQVRAERESKRMRVEAERARLPLQGRSQEVSTEEDEGSEGAGAAAAGGERGVHHTIKCEPVKAAKADEDGWQECTVAVAGKKASYKRNSRMRLWVCLSPGCEHAPFDRENSFVYHALAKHLNVCPFVCRVDNCDKSFYQQCDLKRHQVRHHKSRPF